MRKADDPEGRTWREFGLTQALRNMPSDSPGRAVVEALLARGTLTPEEKRRFKARGLRAALATMPADSPGRVAVEAALARDSREQPPTSPPDDAHGSPAAASNSGHAGLLDELERLAALHERGHLTAEEFEAAKRILLDLS